MKSSVENYIDFRNIPLPDSLLTIEIPSWEAVAQPMIDYAEEQYATRFNTEWGALTDQMVAELQIPNIQTVHQLKQFGMETYINNQKVLKFHEEILPFILSYYKENSNTIMDRDEKDDYISEYIEQINFYADQVGESFDVYVANALKLKGDALEAVKARALEDFTFKIIANKEYDKKNIKLDEAAYETFIQKNVLHNQMDEIELREQMPYDYFVHAMPEMTLSQEIQEHYMPLITVKINPDAEIKRII